MKSLAPTRNLPASAAFSFAALLVAGNMNAAEAIGTPSKEATTDTAPTVDTNSEAYRKAYEKAYAEEKAKLAATAAASSDAKKDAKKDAPAKKDAVKDGSLEDVTVTAKREAEAKSYKSEPISFRRPTPILETPQQITVIDQQLIQDRNATSLQDALRMTPGITASVGEGGNSGGDNFNIRGYSARSDIYVDGVRDNSLYTRDIFATEQVEVTKGASGVYQGKGSTGGSVNLATKAAHAGNSADVVLSASSAMSVRSVIDGNYDFSKQIESIKDAGVAGRVTILAQDGGTARTQDSKDQRFGVLSSVSAGLGTDTKITLSNMYLQQDKDGDYGIPVTADSKGYVTSRGVNLTNWYGSYGLDRDDQTQNITSAVIESKLADGHRLQNITRFNTNERDTVITRPATANYAANTVGLQYNNRYAEDTAFSNQTNYVGEFKTGEIGHTLNVGLEIMEEINETKGRTLTNAPTTKNLSNPSNVTTNLWTLTPSGASTKAVGDTYSVYVNEALHATKWLDVIGGFRYDRYEFDSKSYAAAGTVTSLGQDNDLLSWRGGLVLKPTNRWTVYGTVANSYAPSTQDLSVAANTQNVDPEQTYLYEIGTRWEPILGRLTLGAAYFYTDKFNLRQTDAIDPTIQTLTGASHSQGIELTANGNITKDWNIFGGVSYMTSEITKSSTAGVQGKELALAPDWSATLMTSYNVGMGWTFGGGMRYMGERWINQQNTLKLHDYVVFDAFLRKQITKWASVQVNVDNLFDEQYIETASRTTTAATSTWATPGAGRIYSVTARLSF